MVSSATEIFRFLEDHIGAGQQEPAPQLEVLVGQTGETLSVDLLGGPEIAGREIEVPELEGELGRRLRRRARERREVDPGPFEMMEGGLWVLGGEGEAGGLVIVPERLLGDLAEEEVTAQFRERLFRRTGYIFSIASAIFRWRTLKRLAVRS